MDDVREARRRFPVTDGATYLNTAAVGLASRALGETLHRFVDRWVGSGLDFTEGETAAEHCRSMVAGLMGVEASELALIASASAAAGLVAAQLGLARPGENVVIGEREFSSNHFPWVLLGSKGYDVRQVPFRNGGLEPGDVERHVDRGTRIIALSGVQAATGHRSDLPAIGEIAARAGALVYVDGSQMVGAVPVADALEWVDVMATGNHKFLLNAGRGMGYCYLSPKARERFTPISAGWKAARRPYESYFGPDMDLSPTASRFDNSMSWLGAVGDEAALAVFEDYGAEAIYRRNEELAEALRDVLTSAGWAPVDLPPRNRSTIVAVPLGGRDPVRVLADLRARGVVCAARDGNLRISVHLYNHEDDLSRLGAALREL